jgi:O-acetyl-ADP-ribose deacetylase (regulator of RNase III)
VDGLSSRLVRAVNYVRGDATEPPAGGNRIIGHICNDIGGWGRGFVVAVSKRWPEPERAYRRWAAEGLPLGEIQLVEVAEDLWVANMIGQHGIFRGPDGPPIRYGAVQSCLEKLAEEALRLTASVHLPRIGAGLAGGRWERIEPIIIEALAARDVPVTVYDL